VRGVGFRGYLLGEVFDGRAHLDGLAVRDSGLWVRVSGFDGSGFRVWVEDFRGFWFLV
jgi:hypothetical protein